MTCFRLFILCLFGLAAMTARAGAQPDPPRPLKKPSALLSSRVVQAEAPAALSQPGTEASHRAVFIQLASLASSKAALRR